MDTFWQDLKFGARMLRRSSGFTTVAVLTLALGIGANTAIFQLLDAVRLRRLPVQNPQELVDISFDHQGFYAGHSEGRYPVLTNALWEQIRERQQAFSGVFAWGTDALNLSSGGEARYAQTLWVSGDFFRVLGVQPVLGRVFGADNDRKGCGAPGAVISYSFWRRAFGSEPGAVGRTLTLEGQPIEIIGVTPASFFGVEVGRNFDVAVPLCAEPLIKGERSNLEVRNAWWLAAMGRLKMGWTAEKASAQMAAISRGAFEATIPPVYDTWMAKNYSEFKLYATPAATGISALRDEYENPLWLLLATTGLVLLIACANLANLLLARASAREREIAVRLALGASRTQLVRQLMAESALLASAGAAAGVLLAQWVSDFLVAFLSTEGNPLFVRLGADWRPLAFAAGLAALTCILLGLVPAWQATRTDPGAAMKAAGRGLTASRYRFGLRRALMVSQVAFSLVLLVTALLFTRSLSNLLTQDAGFRQDGILVVNLDLTRLNLPLSQRQPYKEELASKIRALPRVESAADALMKPWGDFYNNYVFAEGTDPEKGCMSNLNWVGPGYLRTLEMPLLAGRDFNARDTSTAPRVVIVNEVLARKLFGGSYPVGKRFVMKSFGDVTAPAFEVIGLVKNSKYMDLREDFPPIAFFPRTQERKPDVLAQVFVKSNAPLGGLVAVIKRTLSDASPEISVQFQLFEVQIHDSLLRERLMATLSGFFGFLAALLATIGLYGVMAYLVVRRTNEIGIRMALGANPGNIARMILGEATTLLAIGLAAGLALSLLAARAAGAMLYGLKPNDPVTIALAVALLAVAALAASYFPARRAANVDPMVALRYE